MVGIGANAVREPVARQRAECLSDSVILCLDDKKVVLQTHFML